jgi:hypothetical protein
MRSLLILLFVAIATAVSAQDAPALTDLPRKVYREQRKEIRDVERRIEQDREAGYDILPSPIEVPLIVPEDYEVSIKAIESWQTRTQRIPEIRQRIAKECTHPIHFRISDSGADQAHQDLKAGFTVENNWTTEDNRPGQHGTHVAGDVLQFVYPAIETGVFTWGDDKSLLASGSGSFAWATNMFNAEVSDTEKRTAAGQTVIWNCSWGAQITSPYSPLESAMQKQVDAGALIVAAAGNSGGAVGYPGFSDYTFCVSSLDESMALSSFSSRGASVTSTAGGRNIYSTLPGNRYGFMSGTSMASPSFAAFLGIAIGKWGRDLLPDYDAIRAYFRKVGTKLGDGNPHYYGDGYAFIEAILDTKPGGNSPDPDPEPEPEPEPEQTYIAANFSGPFVMRWRYIGGAQWNIIVVTDLTIEALANNLPDDNYREVADWLPTYFRNRGIEMPTDMGAYDAVWWTGQFLEYIAGQKGLTLDVIELQATEETTGGTFHAVDFDRANARSLSEFFVRVVDLD